MSRRRREGRHGVARSVAARLGLAALSAVACLAMAEFFVRWSLGGRPLRAATTQGPPMTSVTGYFWIPDEDLGFRNRPGGRFVNDAVLAEPLVTTDPEGNRGGPANLDRPAVLLVGDSVVFAAEVGDEQTPAAELWRAMGARADLGVRTLAVRGYNTVQARRMIESELGRLGTVKIVVHVVVDNDFVENLNPVVYFPAVARTTRPTGNASEPFEDVAPKARPDLWQGSLGWFSERDALLGESPSVFARALHGLRRRSAAANALARVATSLPGGGSRVGRVACSEGWVGPVWIGVPEWLRQADLAERAGAADALGWELRAMDEVVRHHGARLIVTEFTHGENRKSRPTRVERIARERGLDFVSLEDAFGDDADTYKARTATGFDGHYGPVGTRVLGRVLAAEIPGRLPEGTARPPESSRQAGATESPAARSPRSDSHPAGGSASRQLRTRKLPYCRARVPVLYARP